MLSTHRHSSCSVPTEHELLPFEQVAEFDQWMNDELARLEERFHEYVTAQSASLELSAGQRGR